MRRFRHWFGDADELVRALHEERAAARVARGGHARGRVGEGLAPRADFNGSAAATAGASPAIAPDRAEDADVVLLTPNTLAVRHWSRLVGGLLYATSPRLSWPLLLRRTFDIDVLDCAKCHGRLRVIAVIADARDARRILERLGIPPAVERPRGGYKYDFRRLGAGVPLRACWRVHESWS